MINKIILLGRIGKDATTKTFQNDNTAAEFSVATANSYKKNDEWVEETEWHNVKVFGKGKFMEMIEERAKKGALVYCEGRIKTRSYDDKEGNKRYVTEVLCDTVKFLDKKEGGLQSSSSSSSSSNSASSSSNVDDDLPFSLLILLGTSLMTLFA